MRSSLELVLLTLIRDGLGTPYELKTRADISLGSTVPALARLKKAGLIDVSEVPESRSIQRFILTRKGATALKNDWRQQLKSTTNDVESVLRIAYLALLNHETQGCAEFLESSSRNLAGMAMMANAEVDRFTPHSSGADGETLRWLRARVALRRLESEADELRALAAEIGRSQGVKTKSRRRKSSKST